MRVVHLIGGGEVGGSRVHVLTLLRRLPGAELVCLMEGPVARSAREEGLPVTVLPMRSPLDLRVLAPLRRHLEGADVVHTHGVRAGFVGRLAATGRVVTTVHSSPRHDYEGSWKRWLYPWLDRLTRPRTDRFVAVSGALRDELVAQGVPPERISVVYTGVSRAPATASLREELGLAPGTPLVLGVGRLEPVKDPEALLEVFAALRRRIAFHGVVVGDGSLAPALRRRRLPGITFLGFRPDAAALIAQADVLVSTSRFEGLSLVLLEALRAGVPAVVTAVGAMPEVLGLAGGGFAVPSGDVEGLAERVERLLRDPVLRADLGRRGAEGAARHFSEEAFLAGTRAVYEETVRRRVAVVGYYGAGNAGDEAILAGLLRALREAGGPRVTVASFAPGRTRRLHGVDAVWIGRRTRGLAGLFRALRGADLCLLGGGGLLQDGHARVVPFWLSRGLLARAAGVPVAWIGLGAGPLETPLARWLVRRASAGALAVTVRDPASAALVGRGEVTGDLALLLPRPTRRPGGGQVAVCLRGREGVPPEAVAGLLESLPGARYVFLALHEREDEAATREVAARLGARIAERPESPEDLAALLAGTDGVLSMRLHGLVLAARSGVPVFAIGSEPKLARFLERAGLADDRGDPRDPATGPRLADWYAGREERRRTLERTVPDLVREARRNVDVLRRLLR